MHFCCKCELPLWIAGIMYVHDEDVQEVAKTNKVICERCEEKFCPDHSTNPYN